MTLYNYLSELRETGVIKALFKAGIVPFTTILHTDIYAQYLILKEQGHKKENISIILEDKFNISRVTVWRIRKQMETEL